MNPRILILLVALALLAPSRGRADVKLPAVFSDHMVLQADAPAPIFGAAAPGESVAVEFNGQKKTVAAGADGRWLVRLDPVKPGGPFTLKVNGKNALTIKDVLAGEVWLASGQSNMRFPLSKASDGKQDAARASHPRIRYLRVGGQWAECSPKTAPNFSAVAFYFAVSLQQHRKVPVGIIENSVNGEVAQNFMSPQAFQAAPELEKKVHQHTRDTSSQWKRLLEPIIPYGIRGVLWYQGEGNRDYPVTYRQLLPALIADWRKHWGQGDFPFLIVQLANYQQRRAEPWEGKDCALREAQLETARSTPNTALAVTIDLGEAKDVHYPNKKPVGERLALAARALAYKEQIEYSGPLFESARFEGGKAIVSFTHLGGGLSCKGDKLTGFLLCGADKKFVRAEARIEGDKVVVSSPKVSAPAAVRYAWERNPECNLCNKAGLPASPFRSDRFVNYFTKDGSN